MFEKLLIQRLNLQLFAEGAGAGDGGTVGGSGETGEAAVPQVKGVKSNPLAGVKYGIQQGDDSAQTADVQEEQAETAVVPDRKAEFEKLIKGEYKDLYDAKMQDTIKQRLKSTKETVDKYTSLAPTLELLSKKYGVDANDVEALNKAIEEDNAFYEDEAMKMGIPVEELKRVRKMERENAELRRERDERQANEDRAKIYAQWVEQEQAAKAIYPSLSLEVEAQNPQFLGLLRAGIDVRTAFEVIHKDELIPAAMQYTAKTVEQKLANKIRANGARPTENGNSSQSAAVIKSDVSQLSKSDMAEIKRRVAAGERISFG